MPKHDDITEILTLLDSAQRWIQSPLVLNIIFKKRPTSDTILISQTLLGQAFSFMTQNKLQTMADHTALSFRQALNAHLEKEDYNLKTYDASPVIRTFYHWLFDLSQCCDKLTLSLLSNYLSDAEEEARPDFKMHLMKTTTNTSPLLAACKKYRTSFLSIKHAAIPSEKVSPIPAPPKEEKPTESLADTTVPFLKISKSPPPLISKPIAKRPLTINTTTEEQEMSEFIKPRPFKIKPTVKSAVMPIAQQSDEVIEITKDLLSPLPETTPKPPPAINLMQSIIDANEQRKSHIRRASDFIGNQMKEAQTTAETTTAIETEHSPKLTTVPLDNPPPPVSDITQKLRLIQDMVEDIRWWKNKVTCLGTPITIQNKLTAVPNNIAEIRRILTLKASDKQKFSAIQRLMASLAQTPTLASQIYLFFSPRKPQTQAIYNMLATSHKQTPANLKAGLEVIREGQWKRSL